MVVDVRIRVSAFLTYGWLNVVRSNRWFLYVLRLHCACVKTGKSIRASLRTRSVRHRCQSRPNLHEFQSSCNPIKSYLNCIFDNFCPNVWEFCLDKIKLRSLSFLLVKLININFLDKTFLITTLLNIFFEYDKQFLMPNDFDSYIDVPT